MLGPNSIRWFPVVLTFSFTTKELRADPFSRLHSSLEQLDIKFLSDYAIADTTIVVTKKRNTPKGLQALINGKHIVTDAFVDAIIAAAQSDGGDPCLLEQNFDEYWPNALQYLPSPGEEPVPRPPESFAPDPERASIFEGYSFLFYDQKQYDALLPVITNGRGKTYKKDVVARISNIDDFTQWANSIAGEKGLGYFADGSAGKGAVVVRYIPSKGKDLDWYQEFASSIALCSNLRTIDQRDFLDVIIMKDTSALRRRLEAEPEPSPAFGQQYNSFPISKRRSSQSSKIEVEEISRLNPTPNSRTVRSTDSTSRQNESSQQSRRRPRRPLASRFKGFDTDDLLAQDTPVAETEDSEGLFVSQNESHASTPQELVEHIPTPVDVSATQTHCSQKKRPASLGPIAQQALTQDIDAKDFRDEIVPAAAATKRRRIEKAETASQHREATPQAKFRAESKLRIKKEQEIDILDIARQNKEKVEAKDLQEKLDLAQVPDDLDLAAIRKLAIVEEFTVQRPTCSGTTNDEDDDNPYWQAKWNGRRNFKAFRKQGVIEARPKHRPRTIISLEEVKAKAYSISDDYWLEDKPRLSRSEHSSQAPTRTNVIIASPRSSQPEQLKNSRTRIPLASITLEKSDAPGRNLSGEIERVSGSAEARQIPDLDVDILEDAFIPQSGMVNKTARMQKRCVEVSQRFQSQHEVLQTQQPPSHSVLSWSSSKPVSAGLKRAALVETSSSMGVSPAKRPRSGSPVRGTSAMENFSDSIEEDDDSDDSGMRFKFRGR